VGGAGATVPHPGSPEGKVTTLFHTSITEPIEVMGRARCMRRLHEHKKTDQRENLCLYRTTLYSGRPRERQSLAERNLQVETDIWDRKPELEPKNTTDRLRGSLYGRGVEKWLRFQNLTGTFETRSGTYSISAAHKIGSMSAGRGVRQEPRYPNCLG